MKELYKDIPSISKLLEEGFVKKFVKKYGTLVVTDVLREAISVYRLSIKTANNGNLGELKKLIQEELNSLEKPTLKPVINATGVILHTNLGRAPLGEHLYEKSRDVFTNYCNLELDLESGKRGKRDNLTTKLLKKITKAEDSIIVNNNAAAVYLILNTFACGAEVIVSRGEMIEIGGSFRIPDIIKNSGSRIVEVGTTNRTRISDYESAISDRTKVLLKAHKSNYYIKGFTEEPKLSELADLANKHQVISYYDLGSGLLKKPESFLNIDEPDVISSIRSGIDLVSFSGDKLLGGPQSGIILGKQRYIDILKKSPLMRVLRVGKLTISLLSNLLQEYFEENNIYKNIKIYSYLNQKTEDLQKKISFFEDDLKARQISYSVEKSTAYCGGGTLPDYEIDSFSFKLVIDNDKNGEMAERLYHRLLLLDKPVLGVLKSGEIYFDVYTLNKEDIEYISCRLSEIFTKI